MKRFLLSCSALALFLGGAKAQIVLDKNDLIKQDTTYEIISVDDFSRSSFFGEVDPGKPGADGTYDFRTTGSYGYDTTKYGLQGVGAFGSGFQTAHPSASFGNSEELEKLYYYKYLEFNTTDVPAKNEDYPYKRVALSNTANDFLDQYVEVGYPGVAGDYYFVGIQNFNQKKAEVSILDPKSTDWSSDFGSTEAAKLNDVITDDNDNVVGETYGFYETVGNDFLRTGVGIKIDQGLLATGNPNGTYVNLTADVKKPALERSTSFTPGTRMADSSAWKAQVSQGLTNLTRWNYRSDSIIVNAAGVLYLPRDSFQVTRVWRRTQNITIDSIIVFGTLQSVEIDTQFVQNVEFYAKGLGEPVVRMKLNRDSVLTGFEYLDTVNTVPFNSLELDTVVQMIRFQKKTDKNVSNVGLSYLVDFSGIFSGIPSGKIDTLNAPFSGDQLIHSTDFANGFSNYDSINYSFGFKRGIYDVEFVFAEAQEMEVDGYGTLYLGSDTAEVLRVLVKKTEYNTEIVSLNGTVLDVSDTYSDVTYHLQYWGKNSGIPLVQLDFYSKDLSGPYEIAFTQVPPKNFVSTKGPIKATEVVLFPNPAQDQFTVQSNLATEQVLQVMDLQGRTLLNQTLRGNTTVSTLDWKPGVYLVKMTEPQSGSISTQKLIVE